MRTVFVLLIFFHVASTVEHSLEFFVTLSHGLPDVPEFVAVVVVDGVKLWSCDSNTKTLKPHGWTRDYIKNYSNFLQFFSQECVSNQYSLRELFVDVMESLNQSEGAHILQLRSGCEWDEETGKTASFMKFGYDGEDFMALDLQASTWTALKLEALAAKTRWDADKVKLRDYTGFYKYHCSSWLKEYLTSGRKYLQRKVLPSVSLLQKSPSSPVRCFATGFYPDRAVMFWRKDGEELHEGVDHGEILPNHDDTYQMSADLDVSSEKPGDWRRYECVFQLYGVMEDIVTRLDQSVISSNNVPGSPPWVPVVTGVVAILLLLSLCFTGFITWRKKKNGFQAVQRK